MQHPYSAPPNTTQATVSALRWHGVAKPRAVPWLVKGMLPEIGAGLVVGQWGTFKTAVVLDIAVSTMTGRNFAGHRVKRTGGVLVLASEGATQLGLRLTAAAQGIDGPLPFAWTTDFARLLAKGAAQNIGRLITEAATDMRAKFNVPLALIIFDTLAGCAGFEGVTSLGAQAIPANHNLSARASLSSPCRFRRPS
jgi:hypothetical protein